LAAAVVLFFFIGYWIDQRFGVSPYGKILGVLFGSIGGFLQFFKSVSRLTSDSKEQFLRKKDEV
jgi:F0F1-type ATP synthase assembly protein I